MTFVVNMLRANTRRTIVCLWNKEDNYPQQADEPVDPYAPSLNLIAVARVNISE
jgi:hypothetical protein